MKTDKSLYTARSVAVRVLVITVGVVITATGAACYVLANLGSDPVTAFVQGLGHVLNLNFGQAMNVFNLIFFAVILILYRRVIGIGTVLYTLTLGSFSNIFIDLIGRVAHAGSGLFVRILLVIVGTINIAVGLGIYQSAEFGTGPSDGFNQAMAHYLKWPLQYERIVFDVAMVVGSVIMGGIKLGLVHAGTLVGMFGVGPIMAPVMSSLIPVVRRWAGTKPVEDATK